MIGKLSHFLENDSMPSPSQFLYCRGLGIRDALHTLSHRLQVVLDMSMEGRLIQLDFSGAFDRISHCDLLLS